MIPNHCYQGVSIQGPRAVVRHLYDQLTEHGRFCDVVSPMPLRVWLVDDSFDSQGWYGWRNNNWGTKWDVCEVEVTEPYEQDETEGWFSFQCWTAWGPPIPVWERLHTELGCSVDAEYEDEGAMFAGTWINGDDQCWEPEVDEEEDE